MEDIGKKSQDIKKVLEKLGHVCNTVFCVIDFRTHILQKQYDMIVIDMAVPEENGGIVTVENGYKAINYLKRTTDPIHRPQNIVILSEFIDNNIEKLSKFGVRAIKYSAKDSKWEEELAEEVEYASLLSTKKADIVLLTATDIEYAMVKRMFEWQEFDCLEDNAFYQNAEILNKNGEKLSIISCYPAKMGAIAATNIATKAISMFKPDCIIMLGIAGGNGKEVKCGDIVVAETTVDFCNGSIEDDAEDDEKIQFLPDADIVHATSDIIKIMRKYGENKDLLRKIRDKTRDLDKGHDIHIRVGQMATGPAVIKSSRFTDEYLKKHHKNYLAIDMESYGVYYAASNSQNRNLEYVSIKGISDTADRDKDDDYQPFCSSCVCYLVKHYILNDYKKKILY